MKIPSVFLKHVHLSVNLLLLCTFYLMQRQSTCRFMLKKKCICACTLITLNLLTLCFPFRIWCGTFAALFGYKQKGAVAEHLVLNQKNN